MVQKIKNLRQKILDYIDKKGVSMKPRWFFFLKSTLNVFVFLIVFFVTLYFISFILLVLKEKNFFLLFGMGPGKISYLMDSLPWIIVWFAFASILVLEVLVRRFSFSYKLPTFYTLAFIVFLVLFSAFLINKIDKRQNLPQFGEKPYVPILEDAHRYYRQEHFKKNYPKDDFKKIKKEIKMNFE